MNLNHSYLFLQWKTTSAKFSFRLNWPSDLDKLAACDL